LSDGLSDFIVADSASEEELRRPAKVGRRRRLYQKKRGGGVEDEEVEPELGAVEDLESAWKETREDGWLKQGDLLSSRSVLWAGLEDPIRKKAFPKLEMLVKLNHVGLYDG
jgi:hypothetical protein